MRLKVKIASVLTLLLTWGLVAWQTSTVRADTTDADYDSALSTMPEGLNIDQYFTPGNFTGANSASVTAPKSPTDPTQAVRLTYDHNQLGTIWAKEDYDIDLTKNQKASMWMYFGNNTANNQMGDGMAFVMQNDPRGTKATATTDTGATARGETLGTWGYPYNYLTSGDTSKISALAIQDSWALEFDTFINNQGINANQANATDFDYYTANAGLDAGTTKQHIAAGYPAVSGTYAKRYASMNNGTTDAYVTVLKHQGLIPNLPTLTNGSWHHVTLAYTAPTGSATQGLMTYTINDKNPLTGANQTGQSNSYEVDPAKLTPEGKPTATSAMWDFTGSTGDKYENNLVVFEQIPGLVDATASASITDVTAGQQLATGTAITGGDRLKMTYKLTYNEGRAAWKNIQAAMNIPANVTLRTANIAYADGTSATIPIDGLNGRELDYTLAKTLNQDTSDGSGGRTATITLSGQADNVNASVDASSSTFRGSNAIATADLPSFSIVQTTGIMALDLTSNASVSMAPSDSTTITGKATLTGTMPSDRLFTLHSAINGGAETTSKFTTSGNSGTFSLPVKGSDLKNGANTVDLYVVDAYGDSSPTVTVTINVGIFGFGQVSPKSSFKETVLTGQAQTIQRSNDWSLIIDDTRGSGSGWTLQASATPFTGTNVPGNQLKGNLVYVDADHNATTLNSTATTVLTHADDGSATTNVVDSWSSDTGLLLKTHSDALQDDYSGTVTWTLSNAVH